MTESILDRQNLKIAFVLVGTNINGFGFRRVAAIARMIEPGTDIFFVAVDNLRSFTSYIFPSKKLPFSEVDIKIVGKHFACYDLVCISSMSNTSEYVVKIAMSIKRNNPNTFILYGGVHPTLYPEDAIQEVDAICVGEGEKPFAEFLTAIKNKQDYTHIKGLWFNSTHGIIRNPLPPLNSNEELNSYQMGYEGFDSYLYDLKNKKFRKLTEFDYIKFNGLIYYTIWTLGCPFSCTYCSNKRFENLNKNYLKLRYCDPEHMVNMLEKMIKLYPYTKRICLHDDNLITLPLEVIRSFSELYKKRIGIPFIVGGIHPNTCSKEKIDILASAGLIKVRMGIQSGSENMLRLYERNTPIDKIEASAEILADSARKTKMVPPAYDIILDNPTETKEDIIATLQLFNNLKRPFTLNLFSLRALPGTKLTEYFEKNKIECYRGGGFSLIRPTTGNILLYLLTIIKIPSAIFDRCLSFVKGYNEPQREHPLLLHIARVLYQYKRRIIQLSKRDFSAMNSRGMYYFWKIGRLFKKNQENRMKS
jgi:radical SAM superfamily enzyme YgiQ (UPF0313 family)